jgi:hypothetical protein
MFKKKTSTLTCLGLTGLAVWAGTAMGQEFGPRLLSPEPLSEPMLLPGLDLPVTGPLVMPEDQWFVPAVCFDPSSPPTQEEMAAIYRTMRGPGLRYNIGARWNAGTNTPLALTWSFVPDGTVIPRSGSISAEGNDPSTLFATMDSKFGGQRSVWINYIQGCFDRWSALTGVRYTRIRYQGHDWDDGASFPLSSGAAGLRGDVRISMHPIDGNGHVLAYCYFPSVGDVVLDSAENWENNGGAYNELRNVFSHEHGHGLGLAHVCPTNQTKLMEPFYSSSYDGPQHDDILAVQSLYGDTYEPNNNAGQATVLNFLNPLSLETTWSIGDYPFQGAPPQATATAISPSDQDWFRGSVLVSVPISVSVTPHGMAYDSSTQNDDASCNSGNIIDTLHQALLRIQLIGSNGTTVLATATATAGGQTISINNVTVPAGNFYVVISAANTPVLPQAYTWSITSGSASPPNDNCSAAIAIGFGTAFGSNYGAHGDGEGYCDPVGTVGGSDVWYRFTAPCSGQVHMDTCGSSIQTLLSVYPGTQPCPPSLGSQIAASCYASNNNPCVPYSSLNFAATGGSSYLVRVAGISLGTSPPTYQQGGFVLHVSSPSILNEDCSSATAIAENQQVTGSTCGAAPSNIPASCALLNASPDVWYRYVPSCSGRAAFEMCGSSYDTVLVVYRGPCDNMTEVGCNDDNASCSNHLNSYLEADVDAGQTYFVRVSGFGGESGNYSLYINLVAPLNQTCGSATAIAANGTYTGSTCLSQATGAASCGSSNTTPAVWFSYTASCTGTLFLDTCGSAFDTVLSAYTGACSGLTQVACDDDSGTQGPCAGTLQSFLTVPVTAGAAYKVRLSGFNGSRGRYTLHAYYQSNNTCGNAAAITSASTPFSTQCASADGSSSCGSSNASPAVWFRYTPACTGTMVADTCGSGFDTVLSVYSGSCDNLTELACNDDSGPPSPCDGSLQSYVTAPVQAGMTYLVRISGYNGRSGTGTLHVACHAPCVADVNGDFSVNVQDYLAYLQLYAAADPRADINHSGAVNVQDYLAYLQLYAAGCP